MKNWKWILALVIGTPIGFGIAGLYMLLVMGNYPIWIWGVSIVGAGVLATGITKFCDHHGEQIDSSDEVITPDWKSVEFEDEQKKKLNKDLQQKRTVEARKTVEREIKIEDLPYDKELDDQIFAECFANNVSKMHHSEKELKSHIVSDKSSSNHLQDNDLIYETSYENLDDFDQIYLEAMRSYLLNSREENSYQKRR